MGVKSPIFNGQKAKVYVDNTLVGIFTSCTWSSSYAKHEAWVLGRTGIAQQTYLANNAIRVSLSGFRVIGSGPFAVNTVPELKTLMDYTGITIKVTDRETDDDVATLLDFYAADWSTGVNARDISTVTVNGDASMFMDETTDGSEPPNATSITDGSPGSESIS